MIYYLTDQIAIDFFNEEIVRSNKKTIWNFLNSIEEIAVDTETTGLDPFTDKILCVQLGNEEHQVVIDFSSKGNQEFTKEIFKHNAHKLFLFQNAKFDLGFLMVHGIYLDKVYDTFLAEQVLYNGIKDHRKGLDSLAFRYLNEVLDKSIRGNIHKEGLTYRVVKYAADDVRVLPLIKEKQQPLIKEKQVSNTIALECLFVIALTYVEMCGIKVDLDIWEKKCKEDDQIMYSKLEELNNWILTRKDKYHNYIDNQLDLFSDELKTKINWNSQKQLIPIFKELGLKLEVKDKITGKMKESIEDSVIRTQVHKSDLIKIYLEYTKAAKVVSTYGRSFVSNVNPVTGRIHTSFTQILKTGRMSSSPNIQNIPAVPENESRNKSIYERECFAPEAGNTFIDSDYSGQESVILANFSMEPKLIEFYNSGASDLHSFVAKAIYSNEIGDTPVEDIKKKFKAYRQNAKAANFALAYGGNGDTIAKNLAISSEIGYQVEKAYFDAFPELKMYFERCKNAALNRGYILVNHISGRKVFIDNFDKFNEVKETVDNKKFWEKYRIEKAKDSEDFKEMKELVSFYFKKKGSIERESMNFPIQGTAGEQTKYATILLYKNLKEKDLLFKVKIVNLIHDEILLECPLDLADEYSNLLKHFMEVAAHKYCKTVKLSATPVIDMQWTH